MKIDKSIRRGIKILNKSGFQTLESCSGVKEDHKSQERNILYILFYLPKKTLKYLLIIKSRELGFKIKENKEFNCVRIEYNGENKIEQFNKLVFDLNKEKKSFNCRTMGISNWVYDEIERKRYSIQFYDYDYINGSNITTHELARILEIFPYDCIMYETKHGIHFISFSLLHGLNYTKAKVLEVSKDLGNQDYWTQSQDLTLRIAPKWKIGFRRKRKEISEKPIFKGIIKRPDKHIISQRHLEFFLKYMNLPKWVFECYNNCDKRDYKIKIYHYKTRD